MKLKVKCAYCGKSVGGVGKFDADPIINRIVLFCGDDCKSKYYEMVDKRGNNSQIKEKIKNPNKVGGKGNKPKPSPNIM